MRVISRKKHGVEGEQDKGEQMLKVYFHIRRIDAGLSGRWID